MRAHVPQEENIKPQMRFKHYFGKSGNSYGAKHRKFRHTSNNCKLQNLISISNASTTLFPLTKKIIFFDYHVTLSAKTRKTLKTKSHEPIKISNPSLAQTNSSYDINHGVKKIMNANLETFKLNSITKAIKFFYLEHSTITSQPHTDNHTNHKIIHS